MNTHCTGNVQPRRQLRKNWSPRSTILWRTDTSKAPIAQPAGVLEKLPDSLRKQSVPRSPGFPEIPGVQDGYQFYFIVLKYPSYQRAKFAPTPT